jgi:inner membrane transporter RhtA
MPAPALFGISAIFHYLGPSFAVLLFSHVGVLGVAWLRIVSAAAVFAAWRLPMRSRLRLSSTGIWAVVSFGVTIALMNMCFYFAIARLPLSTVAAIEFLGTIVIAASALRTVRNAVALIFTITGVAAITQVRIAGEPLAFVWAFANCVLFMLYVVLGHRVANLEKEGAGSIDRLAASMGVAALVITPIGFPGAMPALANPRVLLAGIAVGVCSSVIPYVMDQLAMARLSRSTFALMLALLPACATVTGLLVLKQMPTVQDVIGIVFVTGGIAIHHEVSE